MIRSRRRAIVLMTTLLFAVILTMLSSALLQLSRRDLGNGRHAVERVRAQEACRAGLNQLVHTLTYAPSSQVNLARDWGEAGYRIDFSGSGAFPSVNNLTSLSLSVLRNCDGNQVGPRLADVVVEGYSVGTRCHLRCILSSGIYLSKSAGSDGPLSISGDSEVSGIRSLLDPTPVGGGLFSRFVSTNPAVPSISVPNRGITFSATSSVVAPAPKGGTAVAGAVPSRQIQQQSNDEVPSLDVARLVSDQSSLAAPANLRGIAGGYELNSPSLTAPAYVNGNLVVRGDLRLNTGSLYVKGDITVLGGVVGEGSIFSDGNVKILGGTSSLRTNQGSGAAVFANGDVVLQGLNADGYLDSLAAAHPAVGRARSNMLSQVASATAIMADTSQNPQQRFLGGLEIGGVEVSGPRLPKHAQAVAGPDGSHAIVDTTGNSPVLTTAAEIRAALGSGFASDAKAQKIVAGLEQYSYDLRGANNTTPDAVNPDYTSPSGGLFNRRAGWDDNVLLGTADPDIEAWSRSRAESDASLFGALSMDHQYRAIWGTPRPSGSPPSYLVALANLHSRELTAIAGAHPADFSWLGSSNLQGIVYARGNLRIENEFTLYGTALAKGSIQVQDRSKLVYVEEYSKTLGRSGPVRVVTQYEL